MVKMLSLIVVTALLIFIEPAYAAPGGKIAGALVTSFAGKVVLVLLAIILLPYIIWTLIREYLAHKRANKDLRFMAVYSPAFEWLTIRHRVTDCFKRIHLAWDQQDLHNVSEWMTDWYWQNQQKVYLEEWKQHGLQNVCKVKKINAIKPLLFVHKNIGAEHEGSMLVVSIRAMMIDYLKQVSDGAIVEGDLSEKAVDRIWTFVLEQGVWKVADIEDGAMTQAFVKLASDLPPIETTLMFRKTS